MHCVWDIEAPLGHVVLLTVVDLNYYYYYPSSECYENWLAVGYNQTSQKDITMCHYSDIGRTIISTSNMLRVFYHKRFYYDAVRFNITLSSQGNLFVLVVQWLILRSPFTPKIAPPNPLCFELYHNCSPKSPLRWLLWLFFSSLRFCHEHPSCHLIERKGWYQNTLWREIAAWCP